MQVAFVARDQAPSGCFRRLAEELQNRGLKTALFIGDGKPLQCSLNDIIEEVRKSEIAVVGMSSSKELAEPELAACSAALEAGVPFGFYLDTANCHERQWFSDYLKDSAFFFAINVREEEKVRNRFPGARVFAAGNPFREDAFFPKFSYQEVREKLGICEHETMVLSPGGKSPVVNNLVWGSLIEALASVRGVFRVILAAHPGDIAKRAIDPEATTWKLIYRAVKPLILSLIQEEDNLDLNRKADKAVRLALRGALELNAKIYDDLTKFVPSASESASSIKVEFVGPEVMSTDDMVPGADLIAEFGSTIGINAAAQRKPVLTVRTAIGEERLYSVSKTRTTELVELSLSALNGADFGAMASCIAKLLTPSGFQPLWIAQNIECPKPKSKGATVRLMADNILLIAEQTSKRRNQ